MPFESAELFSQKGLGGSSHGSTITEGSDGTLYATWYSGSKEKAADVKIFMTSKSPKGSWKSPWLIEKEGETSKNPFITDDLDGDERAELEHEETSEGNPVFYYDWKTARLFLFWATMRGAGNRSGWSACILKAKHSDDGGRIWTPPRVIRDNIGWMTRNKPIELASGELLLPVMSEMGARASMFYRINRKELNRGSQLMQIQEPDYMIHDGVIQPSIVETTPGHLKCWMRSEPKSKSCPNLVAVSDSTDNGHHWTPIYPMKDRIPNPDSGLDAVKLKNDHIVLLCNPLPEGRQKLTAYLSEDNGITFPYSRDLEIVEPDKEYHYPAVIQSQDGKIHVTYTNRRLNIKWVAFDEEWIKNKNLY